LQERALRARRVIESRFAADPRCWASLGERVPVRKYGAMRYLEGKLDVDDPKPATAAAIGKLEKAIGRNLPGTWAALLRRHGSCGFTGAASIVFRIKSKQTELPILSLFGCTDILEDWKDHPDYQRDGLVPIGDDEFNDRFVWERSTGHVYFIDYAYTRGAMTKVASSFDGFLRQIRVASDDE
jgi:hypothetical protein